MIYPTLFARLTPTLLAQNEEYVPPVGRSNRVTANSPPGTNYFNPGSRVLRWTVRGKSNTDVVKLKMIEVVEVNLIVAETFESFFADNEVPPAALAPVFVATLPPDYTSSYDPVK